MEKLWDETLIGEWARGSDAAGELLARRYMPSIYRLCLRMLGRAADAEDATQETFINLCRRRSEATKVQDAGAWLATIAVNVCRNLRSRRREFPSAEVAPPEAEQPPLGERGDSEAIAKAVEELPDDYRVPLLLKFQQGLSGPAIAARLGISQEALRVRVHRGLNAIRSRFR